ncbi:hypothetical protein [Salipiger mucosus]|uniref:hypothetical protein n=1 Tax=Salipiger mucosus TaxID=263378 RepID=UPI001FE0C4A6|nr:hypothetical protein [Salipiger mucosus]
MAIGPGRTWQVGFGPLPHAQRLTDHLKNARQQVRLGRDGGAEAQRQPLAHRTVQLQAQLPAERRHHRRVVQHAAVQQQRKPVGRLRRGDSDRRPDQLLDQAAIVAPAVEPRGAQTQRLGHQRAGSIVDRPDQEGGVVVGDEPGVVHGAGKAHRLARKARLVARFQPRDVGLEAGVVERACRRPEQRAHEALGPGACAAQRAALLVKRDGDLRDHVLDRADLHRALLEDAPDLGHQHAQHVGQAHALGDEAQQPVARLAPLAQLAAGLVRHVEDMPQVQRQHLRQVVARALGVKVLVPRIAGGDRQEAQEARGLERGKHRVLGHQRLAGEPGHERLGPVPVGSGKEPGRVQPSRTVVNHLDAARQRQHAGDHVERRALVARLREGARLFQPGQDGVERPGETLDRFGAAPVIGRRVHGHQT